MSAFHENGPIRTLKLYHSILGNPETYRAMAPSKKTTTLSPNGMTNTRSLMNIITTDSAVAVGRNNLMKTSRRR